MPIEYLSAINWGLFFFYTIGAIGGTIYLVNFIVDRMADLSIAKDEELYDPWEPTVVRHEEPMPWMNEKPISGRKK
jgi:hypothetical protein